MATVGKPLCDSMGYGPFLKELKDKILVLQIFALRLREGKLAPQGNHIRTRTVKDYEVA